MAREEDNASEAVRRARQEGYERGRKEAVTAEETDRGAASALIAAAAGLSAIAEAVSYHEKARGVLERSVTKVREAAAEIVAEPEPEPDA